MSAFALVLAVLPQVSAAFPAGFGDDPDADPFVWSSDLAGLVSPEVVGGPATAALMTALGGLCSGVGQTFVENRDLAEGDAPSGIAFTPDGSRYLIAHRDSRNVTEFDAATGAFVRAIDVSGSPQDVAVTPDGARAIVPNVLEGTVSYLDLATGTESFTVGGFTFPAVVRITADGARAVIGDFGAQELVVLDATTGLELQRVGGMGFSATLSAAPEPGAIALGVAQLELAGNTAVHPDVFGDQIELVDVITGAVTTLASLDSPRGVAVTPDGTRAVVSHTGSDQFISVLDPAAGTIVKTIPIGQSVRESIAVEPSGGRAAVAVSNATVIVDLATDVVGANLNTASVNQLLTTADGQYVLGVGFFGSLIEYSSGAVVANLNNQVSTALGAVSPSAPLAVMAATTFGEDRLVVSTAGAAGSLVLQGNTGEGLEADSTRRVAISLDGQRAVTTNILMDTATVWDVPTGALLGVVPVGNRPSGVAITPDGSQAVVANLDSTFASVIDLGSLSVTDVPISTRGSEVAISPDGQFAYVAVVSGGDGVWRIDLGTLTTSGGKLATGNMGSVGFLYWQSSGMDLSPDGSTLAVCGSFDDVLTLVDTQSWSVIADVPVGAFPVRAQWDPNGGSCFVACRDGNEVTRVRLTGGVPAVIANIATGAAPYEMAIAPDGKTLYVVEYSDQTVGVVDVPSAARTGGVAVGGPPAGIALSPAGGELFVPTGTWSATIGGSFFAIDEVGSLVVVDPSTLSVLHTLDTGRSPAAIAATPAADVFAIAAPRGDGLLFARAGQALVASTGTISLGAGGSQDLCLDAGAGQAGQLYLVLGSASGTAPGLTLDGVNLPLNLDAYFLFTLDQAGNPPFVNTLGLLDGAGEATASIALPPGSSPSLAGVTLDHAFAAVDPVFGVLGFASDAVELSFLP